MAIILFLLAKVDLVKPKTKLLPLADSLNQKIFFDRTFMVSAEMDDGVSDIRVRYHIIICYQACYTIVIVLSSHNSRQDYLVSNAKNGTWEYKNDVVTDMSLKDRVSEIVREQIFRRLHQELPYKISLVG